MYIPVPCTLYTVLYTPKKSKINICAWVSVLTAEIIWYGNENDSRRMVVVNMEIIAGALGGAP